MKKAVSILCLLLLLTGCKNAPAAKQTTDAPRPTVHVTLAPATTAAPTDLPLLEPTPAPVSATSAAEDEARILGHCVSIVDRLPYAVDLDGDGEKETVDLGRCVGADECPRWTIVLTARGQEKRFETDVPCDMACDLWTGDLDEDGAYELFFHGDLASDDYVIYGFRSDLTPLRFEPDERAERWGGSDSDTVYDGCIEGFEDGHIVIDGAVDMLGTHWGVRNYALGDDGVIGPVSTVWTFDDEVEADRALTVTRELKAYRAAVRKEAGEAFLLKPGERIYPLASDGCARLWFETEAGTGGVLLLVPDGDAMWRIDGVPEAEYFAYLPYAG